MSDTTTAPAAADAATQAALERLNSVIDRLIAPDGCPWDSTQTPESLTEYVIEECHELVDAIRSGKTADMVEELGDVAFLILLIGKLMARAGGPSLADALEVEAAKMVRRHPHVSAIRPMKANPNSSRTGIASNARKRPLRTPKAPREPMTACRAACRP